MTTLTDRYVWAVQRALPEAKRADIDRELRASIADAVDARTENGEPESAAERAVLLDLGEPTRLAAGYSNRPLTLIGPDLYVDYVRLLRTLLVIVLPIVVVVLAIIGIFAGAGFGQTVGTVIGTTLTVGVHMCFWTTLLFVVLERTGNRRPLNAFDPDHLPALPVSKAVKNTDLVATVVYVILSIGVLFWQQNPGIFVTADGSAIPVLNPDLWSFWFPFLIAVALAQLIHAVYVYRRGRWTYALAGVHALIQLASGIPIIVLLMSGRLLNPAFFAEFGADALMAPGGAGNLVAAVAIAVIVVGASIDRFVKAARTPRT
ncbi:MAG: permease prefix domain 1-containing protein [Pseudolysinimonas sp.]|uniref:permease prefix domain 1-containing protein n=1 Tax=Pseudolysinimonas sp. TaxID=2680009 RepID=UPI0032651D86